jgi:hypothetical protein
MAKHFAVKCLGAIGGQFLFSGVIMNAKSLKMLVFPLKLIVLHAIFSKLLIGAGIKLSVSH